MSYTLIVAEVRRGVFEERNLDSLGLGALLGAQSVLVVPDGAYEIADAQRLLRWQEEEDPR